MRPGRTLTGFLTLVLVALMALEASARDGDQSLSPYFFVQDGDPGLDRMPLKSTAVRAAIAGVIADVRVTQVYRNEGRRPLEAVYVFPGSTRAAVYALRMTVGERTIVARIEERGAARRQYENARQEGRGASLLEQERPNVFRMHVANILPGDVVEVELRYTELLVPRDAVYAFVYPTVVGPRYAGRSGTAPDMGADWVANPYLRPGQLPCETLDLTLDLIGGLPLKDVASPSHRIAVDYLDASRARVRLAESAGGDRDFIVQYRLAGGRIETGLLLFDGPDEDFFLLMVQPPQGVSPAEIPPREYVFVVDVSGSMHGFPLDVSKQLLRDLIGGLRPTDTFNVLLFAGGSTVLAEQSLTATHANVQRAVAFIDRQQGGGGTELLPALERALELPRTEGVSRSIVIATDGYVTVEEATFELVRHRLADANVFAFGIGTSVNRYLIEGLARVGLGEAFVLTDPRDAPQRAAQFRKLVITPVLTDVSVTFDGFETYDVEPPSLPDVMAERPVIVFGKWTGPARGRIRVRGQTPRGPFVREVDAAQAVPAEDNAALRYLWARQRMALLGDYNALRADDRRVAEITRLGLAYNLLSPYTSFVAIDTRVRRTDGQAVTVRQPLPLPAGVSDLAVGEGGAYKNLAAMSPRVQGAGARDAALEMQAQQPAEKATALQIKDIQTTSGLDPEAARRVLEAQRGALERCWAMAGRNDNRTAGEIVFKMELDARGRVTKIVWPNLDPGDVDLARCLEAALSGRAFPVAEAGQGGTVTVTLLMG